MKWVSICIAALLIVVVSALLGDWLLPKTGLDRDVAKSIGFGFLLMGIMLLCANGRMSKPAG